jgi:hypothetical protein
MTDYTSWHVGMKVVCVDDNRAPHLIAGEVYTVAKLFRGPVHSVRYGWLEDAIGVGLVEFDTGADLFDARRFRPVQKRKTDISIFTAMLHDKKEHVDA